MHLDINCGKSAKINTASDTTTNVWKDVGRREAKHTEAKMEALSDIELDTLKWKGDVYTYISWQWLRVVYSNIFTLLRHFHS